MAQPIKFVITADFSNEESNGVSGRSSVRTAGLDGLMTALKSTTDQIIDNLALLQRDDGALIDGIVEIHTLSAEVLALLSSTAWTVRGGWVTATDYEKGDIVLQSDVVYVCIVAHTSGVFATDLAADYWGLVANSNASLIDFLQAGTAPTTRSVQDKNRDIVATGDHASFTNNLNAASGRRLYHPGGTKIITAEGGVPGSTTVEGDGPGSIIQTNTTSFHLLAALADAVKIRNLKLVGANGSTVLNNSGASFAGFDFCELVGSDLSGMSGMALYANTTDYTRALFNYIHELTGNDSNSCDIGLYTDVIRALVLGNILNGGAGTEVGVLMQLNSTKNKLIANYVGAHTTYGILEYDLVPKHGYNLVAFNTVEDIDGATLGGNSGSAIYSIAVGGGIICFNHIRNTNINTTVESLVPAALAIDSPFSPMLAMGNMIYVPNWYGVCVSNIAQVVELVSNHVFEPLKKAHYAKNSSHVNILGGSATMLTAAALAQQAVVVNTVGGGPFVAVSVNAMRVRGSAQGISFGNTDFIAACLNTVTEVDGIALSVTLGTNGAFSNNNLDSSASAAPTSAAVSVNTFKNGTFTANVVKATAVVKVQTVGDCTGSFWDKSNIIVGGDMNSVANEGTGMMVECFGTEPPTVRAHRQGDKVWNKAPGVGKPDYWLCTATGTPGTWAAQTITPGVSADKGNAAATLTAGTDETTQRWNTVLTADRAVTLSTTGVWNGAKFRIVRTAAATGAFNLNVGTGPLKALVAGTWCDVEYNGSAWMLTAYGAL